MDTSVSRMGSINGPTRRGVAGVSGVASHGQGDLYNKAHVSLSRSKCAGFHLT